MCLAVLVDRVLAFAGEFSTFGMTEASKQRDTITKLCGLPSSQSLSLSLSLSMCTRCSPYPCSLQGWDGFFPCYMWLLCSRDHVRCDGVALGHRVEHALATILDPAEWEEMEYDERKVKLLDLCNAALGATLWSVLRQAPLLHSGGEGGEDGEDEPEFSEEPRSPGRLNIDISK